VAAEARRAAGRLAFRASFFVFRRGPAAFRVERVRDVLARRDAVRRGAVFFRLEPAFRLAITAVLSLTVYV